MQSNCCKNSSKVHGEVIPTVLRRAQKISTLWPHVLRALRCDIDGFAKWSTASGYLSATQVSITPFVVVIRGVKRRGPFEYIITTMSVCIGPAREDRRV